MELVNLPEISKGQWKIEKFIVDRPDFYSLIRGRGVPLGETFTRLMRDNTLVMSDTPAEQSDLREALWQARGTCLINGLGIGLLLKNILLKDSVIDVTVVEISQDLIDIVSPHYSDSRAQFVCCDAFEYNPPKGKKYDMVWHDIWDNICSDNLDEMKTLHYKYGRRTKWQGSWCKEECKGR
jgi:spermidine synthase